MSEVNIKTISVSSSSRSQMIDITAEVSEFVISSGITSAVVYVFVPHTTAGVTINENADPDVKKDMMMGLDDIVQEILPYSHMEGNSPAHIKASLTGSSISLFVENGKLVLGTWQGVYFCEYDGPRKRKVFLKIIEG